MGCIYFETPPTSRILEWNLALKKCVMLMKKKWENWNNVWNRVPNLESLKTFGEKWKLHKQEVDTIKQRGKRQYEKSTWEERERFWKMSPAAEISSKKWTPAEFPLWDQVNNSAKEIRSQELSVWPQSPGRLTYTHTPTQTHTDEKAQILFFWIDETSLGKEKLRNETDCNPLKNWPCIAFVQWLSGWLNKLTNIRRLGCLALFRQLFQEKEN